MRFTVLHYTCSTLYWERSFASRVMLCFHIETSLKIFWYRVLTQNLPNWQQKSGSQIIYSFILCSQSPFINPYPLFQYVASGGFNILSPNDPDRSFHKGMSEGLISLSLPYLDNLIQCIWARLCPSSFFIMPWGLRYLQFINFKFQLISIILLWF